MREDPYACVVRIGDDRYEGRKVEALGISRRLR